MLNRHNLEVERFASNEESRYTLKSIQVTPTGTIATNGHYLAWVSVNNVKSSVFPKVKGFGEPTDEFAPFLIDADVAAKIAKATPKTKTLPNLEHIAVSQDKDGTTKLAITDLETPQVFTIEKPKGATFPSWEKVMPDHKVKPKAVVMVSAEYLTDVARFADKFLAGFRASGLRISVYEPDKAVRFDCEREDGQAMTALVMPIRDEYHMHNVYGAPAPKCEWKKCKTDVVKGEKFCKSHLKAGTKMLAAKTKADEEWKKKKQLEEQRARDKQLAKQKAEQEKQRKANAKALLKKHPSLKVKDGHVVIPEPQGAKCKTCGGNMLKAEGCIKVPVEIFTKSPLAAREKGALLRKADPVKYGDETRYGARDKASLPRCPDCGCVVGNYHHPNCDQEECPNCHRQLLMCSGECGESK